ncbi:sodium:proton antiporter [Cryobacterium algoritolerans]|uniref:Sodium:proton antiporter n=1 Tax=Cryobacterium algoritolerans TaxID=1259184 RepID=A0A4R8WP05_9MICO|nr:cation:proton antiporter [Cryobacterium algoritolerans]TFC13156.1 sodium:proton antiporter [Cryobacterium algoritolerans]
MTYSLLGVLGILTLVGAAVVGPRLGVAAPLVLVLAGVAGSLIPGVPAVVIPPEFILTAVLPPLLYAGAVNIPVVDFRRNAKAITGLSVLLVMASAFIIGLLFHWLLPALSLPAAVALGAVVSPPDAVAATSIGRRLGLPPRLVTLLHGESLVNDASALVLLRSAVAATAGSVAFINVIGDFAYAVIAAILIGLVVGQVTVWLRSHLGDVVLNTTISFAVPFLAFIPANEIKASGVLAVVVAGVVTGHKSARLFSAQDRINQRLNWRTAQFVLENGVFLVMGFGLKGLVDQVKDDHFSVSQAIGLGLLATLVLAAVRIAFVIPLLALLRRDESRAREKGPAVSLARWWHRPATDGRVTRKDHLTVRRKRADFAFVTTEGLDWRGGAVLAWSGMRGVVTVAAAHSLPAVTPYRAQLLLIAFTVAIASLLVQGGTLPLLIRTLGITGHDQAADREELSTLVAEMTGVGLAVLDNPAVAQDDGRRFDPEVVERVRSARSLRAESLSESPDENAAGPQEQYRALRLRVLQAERAALLEARSTGSYSSRVVERAQHLLDSEEFRLSGSD